MAQVGRQGQYGVVEIDPLAIPAEEPLAGKGMTQVINPRGPSFGTGGAGQVRAQLSEGDLDRPVGQRGASLGDEEGVRLWRRMAGVAESRVGLQGPEGRGM